MTENEFVLALTLVAKGIPFNALIAAALLSAENEKDRNRLARAFPDIRDAVEKRTKDSQGGISDNDILPQN